MSRHNVGRARADPRRRGTRPGEILRDRGLHPALHGGDESECRGVRQVAHGPRRSCRGRRDRAGSSGTRRPARAHPRGRWREPARPRGRRENAPGPVEDGRIGRLDARFLPAGDRVRPHERRALLQQVLQGADDFPPSRSPHVRNNRLRIEVRLDFAGDRLPNVPTGVARTTSVAPLTLGGSWVNSSITPISTARLRFASPRPTPTNVPDQGRGLHRASQRPAHEPHPDHRHPPETHPSP